MAEDKAIAEVDAGISKLGRITSDIKTKSSLFNTPQDTRANHDQLNALAKEGHDTVQTISNQIQSLTGAASGANKSAVRKLSKGFQAQMAAFEAACNLMVESEKTTVAFIRKTSIKQDPSKQSDLQYNEDQLYAQAQVSVYNEDGCAAPSKQGLMDTIDLVRREDDIIKINHQLREIKAAYQEVDGLIKDQEEVVVQIMEHTEVAAENARDGLENVQQADKKTGYCTCTCCYLCTIM
ncbi:syntaxin 7-like protein [Achlya hypogyna]|uniref:Syntaxin 7-like protein n=1 Tax=Achlya hypogyna TaxID=1202772 RepID=A0A1V9YKE2_ACHHY|nr:syntaxin 7-like protein [Achlya hypogyna]